MSEPIWNVESLKEFMTQQIDDLRKENDRRFASQEKAVETAFEAAKEAVIKSEIGVEKRSDAVYVSLSKLQEALASLMPRAEAEQRFASLSEKITNEANRGNLTEGVSKGQQLTKANFIAYTSVAVTILGGIVLFANTVLN